MRPKVRPSTHEVSRTPSLGGGVQSITPKGSILSRYFRHYVAGTMWPVDGRFAER
jgi:hypothetical protein